MHGSEAPEVNFLGQTQFHRGNFDLPIEQTMPVDGLARTVGKNQVFRPGNLLLARHRSEGAAATWRFGRAYLSFSAVSRITSSDRLHSWAFGSHRILSKNGRRCLLDPTGLTEFVSSLNALQKKFLHDFVHSARKFLGIGTQL